MKTLEGNVIGKGLKVGIVAARFNEFIVNKLIGGAEDALVRHGVDTKDVNLLMCLAHLRFRLLHRRWQQVESMMR